MRLSLWVLLVTFITLLASTDAASSKIANGDTTKTTESVQTPLVPARALSPVYNADGKRRLRAHDNNAVADEGVEFYTEENEEARAISISNILDRIKAAVGKLKSKMSDAVANQLTKFTESMSMRLYKMGETPVSLQVKNLGRGNNKGLAFYKEWYEKNVAAGVIKALD